MSKLQPQIIEVKYGTPEHDRVLAAVRQRRAMSREKMSMRYDKWAEMEERFRAYIKPTEGDAKREKLKKEGKTQYTTLIVPYDYAILLTLHTYVTSVFLGRAPIFQYDARHGETAEKVDAVEALIDYQRAVGAWLVPLYIWLMDAPKYGLGVIGSHWANESAVMTESEQVPVTYFGLPTGRTRVSRRTVRIPGYEGNKLFNVRPQDWFPDPRVSIARFQEGEFCGRRAEVGWNTVLKRQQDGLYYNVDELEKNLKARFDGMREGGSSQLILPQGMETYYIPGTMGAEGTDDGSKRGVKNFVELFELEIELSPKAWSFTGSDAPEKWVVTVANDSIVVSVEPLGLLHDKFTYDVLEHEIEGYALAKRSMLEVIAPLNDTLSWLFNSHMHNVRKAMNDQLIVDPSGITMKDLTDPDAGRLVRLKPEAYGKDVRMYVHQLQVIDITQNHLRDTGLVVEMMQKIAGVAEAVMGDVGKSGRKTATEVRTTSSFSVNRLKTVTEFYSAMGFAPLSQKLLQTTQQKYSGDKTFRIAGDLMATKTPIKVDKDSIAGFYDFVPVDGTLPVDRYAQAMVWKEIFQVAASGRALLPGLDLMGMLKHIAFLSGTKDFSQFQVQVQDPLAVQNAVQAGNLVPAGASSGGAKGPDPRTASGGNSGNVVPIPVTAGASGVGRPG